MGHVGKNALLGQVGVDRGGTSNSPTFFFFVFGTNYSTEDYVIGKHSLLDQSKLDTPREEKMKN